MFGCPDCGKCDCICLERSRELKRLRQEAETGLITSISLPLHRHLDVKVQGARIASLSLDEPVYVFEVDGGYWYGTSKQLDEEASWGAHPLILLTYIHGEPTNGAVAHNRPSRDYNVGNVGRGGERP